MVKCLLGRHDYVPMYARLNNDPEGPIEGVMEVCRKCGAQRPLQGLLRKGAKLFNEKGQWLTSVEKAAVI
ncbi:MAG: hypothetical protein ACFFDU_10945 [Candidatus Thorarchaeota archaeon]|jgi:hypothetical protein